MKTLMETLMETTFIHHVQATKLDLSAIICDALNDRAAEMAEAALVAETAANAGPETGLAQPRPPAKVVNLTWGSHEAAAVHRDDRKLYAASGYWHAHRKSATPLVIY